jgi:hypothetical protein
LLPEPDDKLTKKDVMRKLIFVLLVVLSATMFTSAQDIDKSKFVTVHLYRTGSVSEGALPTNLDGQEIIKCNPNSIVTFYIYPGFHKFSIKRFGHQPTLSITPKAGDEVFIHVYIKPFDKKTTFTLTQENNVVDESQLKEDKLPSWKLTDILGMSELPDTALKKSNQ